VGSSGSALLNATLTVQAHRAGSHQGKGWEEFTDAAIRHLANERQNLVFILWGAYAQRKGENIDTNRHLVLKSPHPSPLSAHRGFLEISTLAKQMNIWLHMVKNPLIGNLKNEKRGITPRFS
jgi:uracil DNA glycosylase